MTFKIEKRTQEVEEVVDVVCNRCGKSMGICGQGINFIAHWGYSSKYDMEQWTGDLCEECSEEFEQWILSKSGHIDKMMCMPDGELICSIEEYEQRMNDAVENFKNNQVEKQNGNSN